MPTNEKRTLSPNLGDLIEGLKNAGVDFILVGGLATVIQGAPVTTMDVDVVHSQSDENISRLSAFLTSVKAIYRRPDDTIIEPSKEDLTGKGHVLLTTNLGPLDILSVIEEGNSYEDLLPYSVEIEFRGRLISVLSLNKIIKLKEKSKNPIDKQRLPILKAVLRELEKK